MVEDFAASELYGTAHHELAASTRVALAHAQATQHYRSSSNNGINDLVNSGVMRGEDPVLKIMAENELLVRS